MIVVKNLLSFMWKLLSPDVDGLDNRYDSDVEEEVEGKGCAEVDDCP